MFIRAIFAMLSPITKVGYEVTRSQTISLEDTLEFVLTEPVTMRTVFSLVCNGHAWHRAMGAGIIATIELFESCCCNGLVLKKAINACIKTTEIIVLRTNIICL